jgi:hypothetical protein
MAAAGFAFPDPGRAPRDLAFAFRPAFTRVVDAFFAFGLSAMAVA